VTPLELAQRLIRFDTTNPPGNEARCIAFVRNLLEDAGCDVEVHAKDAARPNLVARVRGGGGARPLLLYGHVDVVTTEGQSWTHAPFSGDVVDGELWGRGAIDMKGAVAMYVSAFLRAARGEVAPRGDVVLAVLSDEENGGDYGARFLTEEHPELFRGIRHAIGEAGAFSRTLAGRRFYPIQVAEKRMCWMRAVVRGPGGHAAQVHRGGTMARVARLLHDLERTRPPIHVTPVARAMIESMARALPRGRREVMLALLKPRLADRALRLLGDEARTLESLLRNTVNATIVRGGEKINVIPSEIELELDGRLLPGFAPADLIRELHDRIGDDVEFEVVRHDEGPAAPDWTLFDTLAGVLRELDPEGIPVPLLQAGVTDGRYFARIGIQTYGFMPMKLPPEFPLLRLPHAADERVPVAALEFGTDAVPRVLARVT
jgi:acetylornithine deacetylase/succinyl-diaminopimelate desuccinylase-like protein